MEQGTQMVVLSILSHIFANFAKKRLNLPILGGSTAFFPPAFCPLWIFILPPLLISSHRLKNCFLSKDCVSPLWIYILPPLLISSDQLKNCFLFKDCVLPPLDIEHNVCPFIFRHILTSLFYSCLFEARQIFILPPLLISSHNQNTASCWKTVFLALDIDFAPSADIISITEKKNFSG